MANVFQSLRTNNSGSVPLVSTQNTQGESYSHQVETELFASMPRRARLTPATTTIRRLLWNLIVGSFCLMVFLGQRDLNGWDALLDHGKMAQATVTQKYITSDKNGTHHKVRYEFITDEGITCTGTKGVTSAWYSVVREGDPATHVTYLPESHGGIWQEGLITKERENGRQMAWIFGTLGLVGLWGASLAIGEGIWRQQLFLLQNGTAVIGQVVAGKITHGSKGESYYHLTYRYPVADNGMQNGSVSVTKAFYERYTQGNPYLTVLYDPMRPHVSRLYSLLGSVRLDSLSV